MRKRDERCQRDLAEQFQDGSGSIRRADHPRNDVARLDLLSDDLLDGYRAAHPERSAAAFELYEEIERRLDADVERLDALRDALEPRLPQRPILAIAVCLTCGQPAIVRAVRSWPIDRAMRRAGLSEREALAICALLAEAWSERGAEPPPLDALSDDDLRELRGLLGEDVDLATVRERYARSRVAGLR